MLALVAALLGGLSILRRHPPSGYICAAARCIYAHSLAITGVLSGAALHRMRGFRVSWQVHSFHDRKFVAGQPNEGTSVDAFREQMLHRPHPREVG